MEQVPTAYALYQSYPNPFNPSCFIRFDVPHSGKVTLRVFDAAVRVVRTVADRWRDVGSYTEVWDGREWRPYGGRGVTKTPDWVEIVVLAVRPKIVVELS